MVGGASLWRQGFDMKPLKYLVEPIRVLLRRWRRWRETLATARKEQRRRNVLAQGEVERLDRIRNPSKYRGK
jgi:hypothetical protein